MTRTKSEVKIGLAKCAGKVSCCRQCPYWTLVSTDCIRDLTRDALEYIMELETEVRDLREAQKHENSRCQI